MIAVLSWGSHKTLRNTLETYQHFGLNGLDDEKVIFFQEISDKDREIAEEYGYQAIGTPVNIGIAEGYKRLVEYATGDLFLFLENDWALLNKPDEQIFTAAELLRQNVTDVVRLRSRLWPGEPLYTRQFMGQELQHPTHLLDAVHWTIDPVHEFTPLIWEVDDRWFQTYSMFANWTNNPTMFRTSWLKDHILSRMGNRDLEIDIQSWWEQQKFTVAQSDGLFTHNRIG